MCPGINILGNIYNIDTPICTSDWELLTFEWLRIRIFPKVNRIRWGCYSVYRRETDVWDDRTDLFLLRCRAAERPA